MANSLTYPARLDQKSEGVLVTFPDFREARTFGRDDASALLAASDCLREALAGRIRDEEVVPLPSPADAGTHLIDAPAEIAAKIAVYEAFKRAKLSKVELAERMDLNESEVRRILDPNHRTKLDRLERAAKELGIRLQVVATPL